MNADWPQQLDKSFDFLLAARSFDNHLRGRDIHDLGSEYAYQAQNFLSLCSGLGIYRNQSQVTLDVRTGGYVEHLAHARQSFALFDDLFDSAIVAAGNNGDAGPLGIERRADRDRFNIETPRTEQPNDPGKLTRLISDYYGKSVIHF